MRIFLTGGTGYIGGAVLDALVRAGHDVTALVRDNEKARRVTARGGHPAIGNLADVESWQGAADAQDGYIHAAFDYASGRGPAIERAALETMIASAKRPRTPGPRATETRFIIYTSGTWILGRPPAVAPGFMIYIMVDSVAATIDDVVAHGGALVQPIGVDAPEITARFRDPAGNVIGLYQQPNNR